MFNSIKSYGDIVRALTGLVAFVLVILLVVNDALNLSDVSPDLIETLKIVAAAYLGGDVLSALHTRTINGGK